MHRLMAETLDQVRRRDPVDPARGPRRTARPSGRSWPMIVLRTPKGWTGPKEIDGKKVEDYWRSHQVPFADMADEPGAPHAARGVAARATGPRSCSTTTAGFIAELRELAPTGNRRMGANPHANGGLLLRDLRLPDFRDYAVDVPSAGHDDRARRRGSSATSCATSMKRNLEYAELPHLRARRAAPRTGWAPSSRSPTGRWLAETLPGGRPPGARRPGDGDPQRAHLPGLARGLPAHRPARPLHDVRGVRPHRRLDVQPAREVAEGDARRDPVAAADRVAQLPAHARTSGGRTTTASRTRIRASSTTS